MAGYNPECVVLLQQTAFASFAVGWEYLSRSFQVGHTAVNQRKVTIRTHLTQPHTGAILGNSLTSALPDQFGARCSFESTTD